MESIMKAIVGILAVLCVLCVVVLFVGLLAGFALHAILPSIELSAAVLAGVISFGIALLCLIQVAAVFRPFEPAADVSEDEDWSDDAEIAVIARPRRRAWRSQSVRKPRD
jgi:TRAP-type C4-dicarboxylate transport system permease small subunit